MTVLSEQQRFEIMTRPQRTIDQYMVETMNHIERALQTISEMREQHGDRSPELQPVERELWRAYNVAQARRPLILAPVPNAVTRGVPAH